MEYPPKPIAVASQNVFVKSFLSMLAFLAIYYFLFDQNLVNALSLVLVLFIHESGHYMAMKNYGYQDVKMFFMPFMGAYVSGEKEKITQKQNVIVLLAGPLPGITIGLLLSLFARLYGYQELVTIANMFVFLNAFNLLPIIPLDGGRLIETMFVGSKEIVLSIFMILSMIFILGIAWYLKSFFILITLLFLFTRLRLLWKTKQLREDLKEKNINYTKSYSELSDEEYWAIKEALLQKMPELKKTQGEETIMNSVKSVLLDPPTKRLSALPKILITLLWLFYLLVAPLINLWLVYIK